MTENNSRIRSKSLADWVYLSFIFLNVLFVSYLCFKINVWEDEVYTINTTSKSLSFALHQAYNFEGQPPLYFILVQLWRSIHDTVFFARILSAIFIYIGSIYIYKTSKLFTTSEGAKWVTLLYLFNPVVIWSATDMRTYALIIMLSSVLIFYFLQYFNYQKFKDLIIILVVSLFGLYTQYYFAFLITALLISYLIFKGWKAFFKISIYFLPIGLAFLPNLYFLSDHMKIAQNHISELSFSQRIFYILLSPQNLLFSVEKIPLCSFGRWFIVLMILSIGLFSLISYIKSYQKQNNSSHVAIKLIVISIFIFLTIFSISIAFAKIVYVDKYMKLAIPLFLPLLSIFTIMQKKLYRVFYGITFTYFIFTLFVVYKHPLRYYDFVSLDTYIRKIERPHEPILFYRNGISLPFIYAYKGSNPIVPVPHQVTYDANYVTNIKDTSELKNLIDNLNSKTNSILFVSDDHNEIIFSHEMQRKQINSFFNNTYRITLDSNFQGYSKDCILRIRRLENINR